MKACFAPHVFSVVVQKKKTSVVKLGIHTCLKKSGWFWRQFTKIRKWCNVRQVHVSCVANSSSRYFRLLYLFQVLCQIITVICQFKRKTE